METAPTRCCPGAKGGLTIEVSSAGQHRAVNPRGLLLVSRAQCFGLSVRGRELQRPPSHQSKSVPYSTLQMQPYALTNVLPGRHAQSEFLRNDGTFQLHLRRP